MAPTERPGPRRDPIAFTSNQFPPQQRTQGPHPANNAFANSYSHWSTANDALLFNLAKANMPLEQIAQQHFPGFAASELEIILIEVQIRMQHQPRQQTASQGGMQRARPSQAVGKQPEKPATKKPAAKQPPFEDLLDMYDEGKQIRQERGISDNNAPDWTKKRRGG